MTQETADRLFRYRKANGYSQEELAGEIGVSRQAISKWERGESSPDTDNLIALARLYGITIDELINGSDDDEKDNSAEAEQEPQAQPDEAFEQDSVSFRNGIHVHNGREHVDVSFSGIHIESENGDSVHIGRDCGVEINGINENDVFKRHHSRQHAWVHAVFPLGVIIAYLIIGFTFERGWALGWLLVFIIPLAESVITVVETKNPSAFAYPVLVTAAYLTVGMFMKIWHPTWIVFLTIPIYYVIADAVKQRMRRKQEDENQS